MLDYCD